MSGEATEILDCNSTQSRRRAPGATAANYFLKTLH